VFWRLLYNDVLPYTSDKVFCFAVATGKWLPKEDKKLAAALRKVTGCKDLKDVSPLIAWEEVAKMVPTRSAIQCRTHW
jgi:hypothetical protein